MLFSFSLKSSILLIFFFHGIIFSILLLFKGLQTENKPSLWLGVFTLLSAFYIVPFMLGYAGWYSQQPYRNILFYVPFQQLFLLPPVLFFYIKTLLDKSFQFSKKDYLHFSPALAYWVYAIIIFLTDIIVLKKAYFYEDGKDKDFSTWYQIAGLISLTYYLVESIKTYNRYRFVTYNSVSFADSVMFRWTKRFLVAFLMLIILRILFFVINPEWNEFGRKFWYYVSFSFLFYYVSISGYTNSILSSTSFKEYSLDSIIGLELETSNSNEFESSSKPHELKNEIQDLDNWKEKLETLMCNTEMYKNPELIITDLSSELGTHSKKISQVINQGFGVNFNDFINQYRIKAFLQKVQGGEHNIQTFLGLAFECGFNSKSTFNRAFKKATSLNPKEYIETHYKK
ncbi:helix-turn-helix domain-containing protein [Flectobacillus roseus]|uniref:Helix-turn-helix domain-containing protein n=1 Tax=Flectobacillus roseus TaxID=502259 RepID=A0ABT6Y724_9BACT|nr:helix-turn-helix domain-containing protein [Flectobacillus roseus]MDI9859372.1 helix-turn-helix domain-containing protein [Flectobacillus roseus]